jgi:hypothetical protein
MSTPTPVPPPSPIQPPTQTVVNLAPDVLNKLSPHETGLPQSWATIIAACIAVTAALLALCGVSRQIAAIAREGQQNRAADARMRREAVFIERMAQALELSNRFGRALLSHRNVPSDQWNRVDVVAYADMLAEGKLLASMLRLLGAQASSKSMVAYLNRIADIAKDPASEGPKETEVATDLLFTLRDELAPPPAPHCCVHFRSRWSSSARPPSYGRLHAPRPLT